MEKINIYAFWTGDNAPSENRRRGIIALEKTGLNPVLITPQNLNEYIPSPEIHPAYQHLNLAHRADYLRCVFMHKFGGGYSDIKPQTASWLETLDTLKHNEDLYAAGYAEINETGVAILPLGAKQTGKNKVQVAMNKIHYKWLKYNHKELMGCCSFYFKKNTNITQEWHDEVVKRLDALLPQLQKHPATTPKEKPGDIINGEPSKYPVPWTYILGDILHPLSYKYRKNILRTLPTPEFKNYE